MSSKTNKRVILSLPGTEYSATFLLQWSDTILELTKQGYSIGVSAGLSDEQSLSHYRTIGTDVLRGKEQIPFEGKMDYDVWVNIDSKVIFTPKQVIELVEDTDKYPIISGVYRMSDTSRLSYITEFNDEYFKKNGAYEFTNIDSVNPNMKHVPIKYTDIGFFACTREVLEKLEYPQFYHAPVEIEGGGEDENGHGLLHVPSYAEAFCRNINSAGFIIHVNTDLRVGHEKKLIV
jgi:hypothetical protein